MESIIVKQNPHQEHFIVLKDPNIIDMNQEKDNPFEIQK